ncbi:transposase-like protein [Paraburkholderia sp. WSM4174]
MTRYENRHASRDNAHGHRFPAGVISCAVRWYLRFQLNLRDIEKLLFERGVVMTYETIRCWCDKFGADFARRVKAARHKTGSTWHLDEMFVTLRGEPYLLWRAVDEHGAELDIVLQKRRDKAAAKRFFKHVLRSCPVPCKIVTDQLRSYPAAKAESANWLTSGMCSLRRESSDKEGNTGEKGERRLLQTSCKCITAQSD